jgi:hypothetical protein
MNFKTTLILMAVLLVVGITALIVSRQSPTNELTPVDQTLLDIKPADVTSLVIQASDGSKIVVGRTGPAAPWTISQPLTAPASGDTVSSIINDLTGMKATNEMVLASDQLKDYGLDSPQFKVRIEAGDKHASLLVGNSQSVGGGVYIEKEGSNKLDVVDAHTVLPDLQKSVSDLRDKKLVSVASAADLKQVTISKPDGTVITLTRDTAVAPWRMSAPTSMPADTSAVDTMLDPLVSLQAVSFVDDATKLPPLALKPQLTITYTPSPQFTGAATQPTTQPSTTLVFGQYDDFRKQNIYVKVGDSNSIAKVLAGSLTSFDKKPLDLRDKNVVKIDRTMVNKITLETEVPPTTSPSERPSITMGMTLTRRQVSHVLGPELPAMPTTAAATQAAGAAATMASSTPSTLPATIAAATMPVVPPSTWVVENPPGDADDDAVQQLLTDLDPLTVDHYFDKLPTTVPSHIYRLTVTTVGPGGSPTTDYPIEIIEPNPIDAPYATYDGLNFVAPRMLVTHLQARLAKNPPVTQPSTPPATQP